MPKKTTTGDSGKAETTAVAVRETAAVAVKSVASETFATMEGYDAKDTRGKEGIESTDLRLPFLSLAQKTSRALDATEDAYIDGLAFGDMYNNETKEIYGKEPILFLPLRHRKRAYLPDDNGRMGETIDWNDPRTAWPTKAQVEAREKAGWDPKTVDKPEGTKVYDWVVLLLLEGGPQLAVISFKSKSFAAGQSLTTFVSMVKGPAFTARYKIVSILESNDAGKFAKFGVQPAGKPSAEEAAFASDVYDSVKDKTLVIEDADAEGAEKEPIDAKDVPY